MTQEETPRPVARKIDLVTREMPDEVLVYDLKTHQAHCLNQTAATVWKYCNGKNSVTDIAELLALKTSTAVDEAAVWLAIEQLGKANLLEARVLPPIGSPRLSRRETVKRLGMGFALAVPVVMSVVAPAAAAAGSCIDLGNIGCAGNVATCCSATGVSCPINTCCINSSTNLNGGCSASTRCCSGTGNCQNVNFCK